MTLFIVKTSKRPSGLPTVGITVSSVHWSTASTVIIPVVKFTALDNLVATNSVLVACISAAGTAVPGVGAPGTVVSGSPPSGR